MKRVLVAVGVVGIMCAATAARAQEDLKKLDAWNGEWTWVTEAKEDPSGDTKTFKGKGEQSQIGDHFYVWRGESRSADGEEMSYIGVTGYDPAKKEYFGVGFRSDGFRETSVVTFGDGTMIVDASGTTATGEKVRSRCTWPLPKDDYEAKCETLTDGEWWVSATEKGVRVK